MQSKAELSVSSIIPLNAVCHACSAPGTLITFTGELGYLMSPGLNGCPGLSGSGVLDKEGHLVGIHHAQLMMPPKKKGDFDLVCMYDAVVPNVPETNVDSKTCERAAGGVSLACLSRKLP